MSEEDKAKAFCERVAKRLMTDGATIQQIAYLYRLLRTDPPPRTKHVMLMTDTLYVNCGIERLPSDNQPYCILARVLAIHMGEAYDD